MTNADGRRQTYNRLGREIASASRPRPIEDGTSVRARPARGPVQLRHERLRRRRADVRLRLSALGVPVPELDRQHPEMVEPQAGHAAKTPVGQRGAILPAELSEWRRPWTI